MSSFALPVTTDGTVCATPVFFRYRGQLQISVAVKAAFQLDPSVGALSPIGTELVALERTYDASPTRSVEVSSDLAPYKSRCDVTLVGHAHAPLGTPTTRSSTRVAIVRDDGQKLVDKALSIASPTPFTSVPLTMEQALGGPGQPNPYGTDAPVVVDPVDPKRPGSYAPISRFAPPRRALAKGIERKALESAVLDLPEDMQWDYFQCAPRDQQIEPPRGGEWLVLDGVHPSLPRVQCRIPMQRGAARFGPSARFLDAAEPVRLICDTIAIDADRWVLSLVYRGRTAFAGPDHAVPTLMLAAALETPGAPIDWARIAATAAKSGAAASMGRSVDTGTVGIDDFLAPRAAIPFAPPSAPSSAPRPSSRDATPWEGAPATNVTPAKLGDGTLSGGPPSSGRERNSAGKPPIRLDQTATAEHHLPGPARSVTPFPQAAGAARPPSPDATPFAAAPVPFVPPAPPSQPSPPFVAPPGPPPPPKVMPPRILTPPPASGPEIAAPATPPASIRSPRPTTSAAPQSLRTPPREATPPPMSAQRPQSMADSLRRAGASATDLASLANAMAPPPPPPPPEDPD